MPPAANDNQGLKIAVAIFATLAFLLGIATYFGFSQAGQNWERFTAESKKASDASRAQAQLQNTLNDLKALAGYEKVDDTVLKTEIEKDQQALATAVNGLREKMTAVYTTYQSADGASAQVDEFAKAADSIAERITADRTRTLQSTVATLTDLLTNQTQLVGAVAADYQGARKSLEQSNQVAQQKIGVEVSAKEKSEADRLEELRKHEEDRKSLVSRLDELQGRNQQQATELTTLRTQLAQTQEDMSRKYGDLMAQFRGLREQTEKSETVLESPNGKLTFVDNTRGEVRTTLGRQDGARERMVFSIFDRDAAGIPSDSPKGTVELIQVGDRSSVGRILKTTSTIDPVRPGDVLYSPAFGTRPRLFALVGKIDMDRDGRDDREDLKRMIESRGGEVSYDLPPAGVGQETGELTPLTSWYVLDDLQTVRAGAEVPTGATAAEEQTFLNRKSEILQEARMAGVRPITLDRLLSMLGYSYGEVNPGRIEGANRQELRRLTNPRGNSPLGTAPTTPPEGE